MATGEELLAAGDWAAARDAFLAELGQEATAAGQEGLARASRALDDHVTAMSALEDAFRLHVQGDAGPDAARVAYLLAELTVSNTGDAAVAQGWLQRARHHLRDQPDDPSWPLIVSMQSYIALSYEKDQQAATALAREAFEMARQLDETSLEVTTRAFLGLALVAGGEMSEGMQLLDEATAAAAGGELSALDALDTYCVLITACERVRDYGRVQEWARHVMDQAGVPGAEDFIILARTEYAHVLARTGDWDEAERQLRQVTDDPEARPLAAAMAWVFLSDLQLRRGELAAADEALAVAEREPYRRAVRHLAMAMRAAVMLAQGSAQAAADLAQRHLRAVSASAMTERIGVLETLVRAALALEDHAAAASAVAELGTIAQTIATAGVRAAAAACRGLHAVSAGEPTTAIAALEDALELYEEAGMVPDVVATLVELARLHLAVGDLERAATRAQRANKEAEALGAGAAAGVAEVLDALRPERRGGPAELTQRESEVIRLVAAGATNQDIAARLFLSIRTVERHLSNIYLKIGAAGPSARTVAASYAHRHGHT